jgi:hypothetical protein
LLIAALGTLSLAAGCETGSDSGAMPADSSSGGPTTVPLTSPPGEAPDATTSPDGPTDSSVPTSIPDPPYVVTGGTAVSHAGGPTSETTTIRSVDFADLTYPTSVCGEVIDQPPRGGFHLVDGVARADQLAPSGPYSVELWPSRSFGDVNDDGHEDTALVLDCSRGGQAQPMGWIYTLDDSGPRPLAGVVLDRELLPITGVLATSLTELRIGASTVITDWDVYLDGDARCCPTMTAVVAWTWTDGGLTPGTPTLVPATARG